MIGAIILSEYNEIVHIFGNSKFHKNIEKIIDGKSAEHVPSTSGISSSTSNNSLNINENNLQTINLNKIASISIAKKKVIFLLHNTS